MKRTNHIRDSRYYMSLLALHYAIAGDIPRSEQIRRRLRATASEPRIDGRSAVAAA